MIENNPSGQQYETEEKKLEREAIARLNAKLERMVGQQIVGVDVDSCTVTIRLNDGTSCEFWLPEDVMGDTFINYDSVKISSDQ